jgi:hypothetical protein
MLESDEAAMLQDRLALLNKQEFLRAKSTSEVISLLQTLQRDIKSASESVRSSAHEVRGYPVEVITKVATRMEICADTCEKAARRAVEVFEKTGSINDQVQRYYLLYFFMGCTLVGTIMGLAFLYLPKLFR